MITLKKGAHRSPEDGLCLMEAVAFLAKEEHSDYPQCACPVLASFGRVINDHIHDDNLRTELLAPLAPMLIGSRSTPDVERRRAEHFAMAACRVFAPLALDSAADRLRKEDRHTSADKLAAHAEVLRGVTDQKAAYAASWACVHPAAGHAANAMSAVTVANTTVSSARSAAATVSYAATDAPDPAVVWREAVRVFTEAIGITE